MSKDNMNENVFFENLGISAKPLPGELIGQMAARVGAFINMPCGGRGKCHKCKVMADGKYVLACQTAAKPGMVVEIPNTEARMQILETVKGEENFTPVLSSTLGIAVDIGTTTLVAYLVDVNSGKIPAVTSALNQQTAFGADVVSRISYASENKQGLSELQNVVVTELSGMFAKLLEQSGAKENMVKNIVIAGNSTMEHLFAGISPASIGKSPFVPQFYDPIEGKGSDYNLTVCPNAKTYLLPNISGFVGGDIVAGIIYSKMAENHKLSLFVDLGTNNEMVLGNDEFLLCCSAAAGPALEGAKISRGMRAASGAIDRVKIVDHNVRIRTIGCAEPVGICGSGLIDAVAELLSHGVITKSGKYSESERIPDRTLAERLLSKGRRKEFVISKNAGNNTGVLTLTQMDIREIQLAKSAISTGVKIMLAKAGKTLNDIDNIYVAGAFGNYLDFTSAKTVGILPDMPDSKIIPLGNSAGLGACRLLCSGELCERAVEVARKAQHIELAADPCFQDYFVNNMSF